jgi:hypothetical protein
MPLQVLIPAFRLCGVAAALSIGQRGFGAALLFVRRHGIKPPRFTTEERS